MALTYKPKSTLKIVEVELSKIKVTRKGLRCDKEPEDLIESIKEIGLINPPTVNQNYELVAGGRRYAAIKALGWKNIPVVIYQSATDERTNLQEELVHLDENLIRLDLAKVEAEDALAKRKRIYEHLYPGAKKGGDRKSKKIKGQESSFDSFVDDTAMKTGKSRSAIKDAVRRSEKASLKLRVAREANQINATQATEIVKLSIEDQEVLVPHLADKSVAEVKQIVAEAQEVGVEDAVINLVLFDPKIKIFTDLKKSASRLTSILAKISASEVVFTGVDREKAMLALSEVNKRTKEFFERHQIPTLLVEAKAKK